MDAQARFEALYREHGGAVRRYVRRRSEAQFADDVVADVFVVAWRRLGDIPDDPLPWLLGVARRVLANRHRGEARNHALQERVRSEQTRAAPARGPDEPTATDVWGALAALSERDREALLLVAWEELPPSRAARVLGVSANTFAVRVYRARRRFARALATQSDDHDHQPGSTTIEVLR